MIIVVIHDDNHYDDTECDVADADDHDYDHDDDEL